MRCYICDTTKGQVHLDKRTGREYCAECKGYISATLQQYPLLYKDMLGAVKDLERGPEDE